MLAVIYFDATRYIIPNWLNAAILVLYPIWSVLSPVELDWLGGIYLFAALLAFGFACFAAGIMGAGDVKLMAVLGLYIGWSRESVAFLFYIGLLGGALALVVLIVRRILLKHPQKPRVFTKKEPIPYGLAIAGAFLLLLGSGRVAGMGEVNLIALF